MLDISYSYFLSNREKTITTTISKYLYDSNGTALCLLGSVLNRVDLLGVNPISDATSSVYSVLI